MRGRRYGLAKRALDMECEDQLYPLEPAGSHFTEPQFPTTPKKKETSISFIGFNINLQVYIKGLYVTNVKVLRITHSTQQAPNKC